MLLAMRISNGLARSSLAGLKSKDYQKAFDNFLMEVDEELYDYYNGSAGPALREAGFKGDLARWWRHINWTAVLIAGKRWRRSSLS